MTTRLQSCNGRTLNIPGRLVEAEAVKFYLAELLHTRARDNVASKLTGDDAILFSAFSYVDANDDTKRGRDLYRAYSRHNVAKNILEEETRNQAHWLIRYLIGACLGEYRHAPRQCSHDDYDISLCRSAYAQIADSNDRLEPTRDSVVTWAYTLTNEEIRASDMIDLLETVRECYEACRWRPSYGGRKWSVITDHILMYLRGELPASVFVDRSWDLKHNGGVVFNKLGNLKCDGTVTMILDTKYSREEQFIRYVRQYWAMLSERLRTLATAILGVTGANEYDQIKRSLHDANGEYLVDSVGLTYNEMTLKEEEDEENEDYDDNDNDEEDEARRETARRYERYDRDDRLTRRDMGLSSYTLRAQTQLPYPWDSGVSGKQRRANGNVNVTSNHASWAR